MPTIIAKFGKFPNCQNRRNIYHLISPIVIKANDKKCTLSQSIQSELLYFVTVLHSIKMYYETGKLSCEVRNSFRKKMSNVNMTIYRSYDLFTVAFVLGKHSIDAGTFKMPGQLASQRSHSGLALTVME